MEAVLAQGAAVFSIGELVDACAELLELLVCLVAVKSDSPASFLSSVSIISTTPAFNSLPATECFKILHASIASDRLPCDLYRAEMVQQLFT